MPDLLPRPPGGVVRTGALLLVLAVTLGACAVEAGNFPGQEEPPAVPDAPSPTPGFGLLSAHGVTDAPCPARTNPENGCISLGAIVDMSGPFAALGEAALDGAQAFWEHVNQQGGVTHKRNDGIEARFDVDLRRHTADNAYDVQTHLEQFARMEPHVLALALSMGTPMTYEALPEYKRTDMAAVPASWWSGWAFEPIIAESGANYCFQALNGMDWAQAELGGGTPIDHVVVVHGPDRYGQDVLRAVEYWADPNGGRDHPRVPFESSEHAVVVEPGGDVTAAVELIDEVSPEVVVLATGPPELAAIATETAERGWQGLLVGTAPTFEPSLLDDPDVADVLESRYVRVGNVGPLSQGGKAYIEMRTSLGLDQDRDVDPADGRVPANDAWIAGWVGQYPLHRAIKEAIAAGDLTRAGVVEELRGLTAKYDGALPWTVYGGVPNDKMTRRTFVFRPDRQALMGQRLVGDAYVGRTAERRYVTRPCTDE